MTYNEERVKQAKADGMWEKMDQQQRLLVAGIKPAYIIMYGKTKKAMDPVLKYLMKEFQALTFPLRGNMLFFNPSELTTRFISKGLGIVRRGEAQYQEYDHAELGIVLGFPPKACTWFDGPGHDHKVPRVSIDYHGIRFVCPPSMVTECVQWMSDYRPIPDELQTRILIDEDMEYAEWEKTEERLNEAIEYSVKVEHGKYGYYEGLSKYMLTWYWLQMTNDDFFRKYGFNFVPSPELRTIVQDDLMKASYSKAAKMIYAQEAAMSLQNSFKNGIQKGSFNSGV